MPKIEFLTNGKLQKLPNFPKGFSYPITKLQAYIDYSVSKIFKKLILKSIQDTETEYETD